MLKHKGQTACFKASTNLLGAVFKSWKMQNETQKKNTP